MRANIDATGVVEVEVESREANDLTPRDNVRDKMDLRCALDATRGDTVGAMCWMLVHCCTCALSDIPPCSCAPVYSGFLNLPLSRLIAGSGVSVHECTG